MTISPPDAADQHGDLGPMHWDQGSPSADAPSDGPAFPVRRRRWLGPSVLVFLAVLVVGVIGSSFVTLPYYVFAPGSARPVDDLVRSTDRTKLFPHKGEVLFATVTEYRARPIDAVHSWFNDNIELIPEKRILGTSKPEDLDKVDKAAMVDSTDTAVAVALRRLGIKEVGSGVVIDTVVTGSAADGHLKPGDVVVAMDGKPTLLREDLLATIAAHKPGDRGTLTVQAKGGGASRTETVKYGADKKTPT